jgi:aldehyde dehydrogenase (NAD+)/aldehyde dehydrogenase
VEISKYFLPSVAAQDDKFFSKAVEGALMFALNQGEICTTPSRILVHEDIADLSSKECKLV